MNDITTWNDILSVNDNKRVTDIEPLASPGEIIAESPLDEATANFISTSREIISQIIHMQDDRLLVITGPCSIHNPEEALEIASNLKALQEENPHLYIVMRTYFEKPRTNVGWKGLLNDPNLDKSFDIEKGLRVGRELLLKINQMGIPTAVEFLDTVTPQYIADLVHWGAIGARTTESQEHRKLVSGLSMPVGFKNGTKGNIDIAIDAIASAAAENEHKFPAITKDGRVAMISTAGNPDGHVILRGGSNGPNYGKSNVDPIIENLERKWVDTWIIIDCSHANSEKDYRKQPNVSANVAKQIAAGNTRITGVMIEANIGEGAQKFNPATDNPADIKPGISITDSCVSLETNASMLQELNNATKTRNES